MKSRYIVKKMAKNREYVFDPSDIYAKFEEKDHKYLNEFLDTIMYGYSSLSLTSELGTDSRTAEHIKFRLSHQKDFLELAKRYAAYHFRDDKITTNIGLFNFRDRTFREKDLPNVTNRRLKERILIPLSNDLRGELKKMPKKALYPPEEIDVDGKKVSQQWLIGKYKDNAVLFRMYKEKTNDNKEYFRAGSGISLEVFVRGRVDGGKYLVRSDFKPKNIHYNIMDGNEFVDYGYSPNSDTKARHDFTYADHTHKYNLGFDLVLPKYASTDIKINPIDSKNFPSFEMEFLSQYNIDEQPIFESKKEDRNASLLDLANTYCSDRAQSASYSTTQLELGGRQL